MMGRNSAPAIQGSLDVTRHSGALAEVGCDGIVVEDGSSGLSHVELSCVEEASLQSVPDIIVETCAVQRVECEVEQTQASLVVPTRAPKKARTNSDSVLYAKDRQRPLMAPEADRLASLRYISSQAESAALCGTSHEPTFAAANMDYTRRYSDPFVLGQQVSAKFNQASVGIKPEVEVTDLSHGGKKQEEEGDSKEDSLLLFKRLKLKRYLHDRYQLGLESTSRLEIHSDPETMSPSRREGSGSDESQGTEYRVGSVLRLKDIAPLVIKSETGSEPATPSVFPSPTPSVTSYSPVFGSPHSFMDSPSCQGSFFHFQVPPRLPVMSSVHDWMARDGEQPAKLSRFPTVSEYPLMPRFVTQQRMDMLERSSTLPGSSSKRHLWRPMATSSLHQPASTPSPLTTKTRFLFQPEAFTQHLPLTESPPRSPFSPDSGWTPRPATLPPNYQASAGISIPSRPFITQQNISAAASYPPPQHFSQASISPGSVMMSFTCPVCHNNLPSYAALANHMVTHVASETKVVAEGSKAYVCKGCKRTFSRSDMLTRHMRLHTGLKPYECAICCQVFSRSDHLHTHLRTHTGEKPYQCSLCSYAAPRRDMITRHMRVHGKRAMGSTRGRSLSSSSCSDGVSPAADVGNIHKYSLFRAESAESSDQSVQGSGSPTSRSQFWNGAQCSETYDVSPFVSESESQLNAADNLLQVLSLKQTEMKTGSNSGYMAGDVLSEFTDAVLPRIERFIGSDKDSSSPAVE